MASRIRTGFHRLAILLSLPVALLALGIAVYALFISSDGDPVPDPAAKPALTVVAWNEPMPAGTQDPRGPWAQFIPAEADHVVEGRVGGRNVLLKAIDGAPPLRKAAMRDLKDDEMTRLANLFEAFTMEERRRGATFQPASMPVLVGDVLVYYPANTYTVFDQQGLKLDRDWRSLNFSGLVLAAAILLYALIRGIGWVVAGFAGKV